MGGGGEVGGRLKVRGRGGGGVGEVREVGGGREGGRGGGGGGVVLWACVIAHVTKMSLAKPRNSILSKLDRSSCEPRIDWISSKGESFRI